jgi:hypothetical protein
MHVRELLSAPARADGSLKKQQRFVEKRFESL